MTWYKEAQAEFSISDFSDRNRLNAKIEHLKDLSALISYASSIAFQTQQEPMNIIGSVINDKSLSSYPSVLDKLNVAYSRCKDNPSHFQELCLQAMDEIVIKIANLEKQREEWSNGNSVKKGLL